MSPNYCSNIVYKMSKSDLFILTDENNVRNFMFRSLTNIDYNIKSFLLSDNDSLGKLAQEHKTAKYIIIFENIFDEAKKLMLVPEYCKSFNAVANTISMTHIYILDCDKLLFDFDNEIIRIHNFLNLPPPGKVEIGKLKVLKNDPLFTNVRKKKDDAKTMMIENELEENVIVEYDKFIEIINSNINDIKIEFNILIPPFSTNWKEDYQENVVENVNNITISIRNFQEKQAEKDQEKQANTSNRFSRRRCGMMHMRIDNR